MKFPHYHQLEARDCGPTCLKIIARYYGKSYSLAELKEFCEITRQGVSLQDIINGASMIGFETMSLKLSIDKIMDIPLPAILYWRQDHYVVLYDIKKNKKGLTYYLSDPSFGKVALKDDLFTSQWLHNDNNGIALLLEPNELFIKKLPLPQNKWTHIKKAGNYFINILKLNKYRSSIALILILIGLVGTWLFPSIFKKMIDEGVLAGNADIVLTLLITQFVIFISQIISDSVSAILLMQINFKVSVQFLVSYLYKLIKLPLKIFDNRLNSDLMMRMDDSDRIQNFLTFHSLELLLSTISLTVFSVMLFFYNQYALYIFLVMSILSAGWTVLFLNKRKLLDYSRFTVASETKNSIYELINEMPEIKINNAHKTKISQWEILQIKLNKINLKALFLNYYQIIGSNFFNKIKDIFITALCAYWVIDHKMTIGTMMTIGFILGQLNGPIVSLINIMRGLQDAKLSFNRLDEIQQMDEEDSDKTVQLHTSPSKTIILNHVTFKYEGNFSPCVLNDVSAQIPIGKITAIVGSSGSGKTTLLKLLLAIYSPNKGEILLDGQDMKKIVPDSWRRKCGVVLQDGYIYSGTYAENIAIAEEVPDLSRVKYASDLACISDFIESLPMGYNSKIGKVGAGLSGGQKQRILIARAIYRNPDFIFLDEATSSLDANNEKKILANLTEFFKGKTVVIIAHRLSTVKNADQIIVLEKGVIVEQDNHEGLIKTRGRYFELIKNQLELGA